MQNYKKHEKNQGNTNTKGAYISIKQPQTNGDLQIAEQIIQNNYLKKVQWDTREHSNKIRKTVQEQNEILNKRDVNYEK